MLQDEQDVGNEETDFRIKNLLSWQNILSNRQIAADIEEKWANQGEVFRGGISPIYLSSPNKWKPCHGAIVGSVGYLISERHWKSTFDFSKIVSNYGLKRGRVWQIRRFISQFFLKLYIQFWKYFHNIILGRLGKGYCKKKLGRWNFWPKFLARLPQRL